MSSLTYPIEQGIILNWEDIERIWHHAFINELKVNPEEYNCLLTETPLNSEGNRNRIAEIMFEKFNCPAIYIAMGTVLSLYSSGRTTGLVLESGHSVTHAVPVIEGYTSLESIIQLNVGGSDLTDYLTKLLSKKWSLTLSTPEERNVIEKIKKTHCFVSIDYKSQLEEAKESSDLEENYTLPDGNTIRVKEERFQCPEALFNSALIGKDFGGLHLAIFNSISKVNAEIRQDLYNGIVLAGGNTMFEGLPERVGQEVGDLVPENVKVKVVVPPDRNYAAWIGGSILAYNSTTEKLWITKEEFMETGASILRNKL